MKKKQWIIDGVAYETELSPSEKKKMMGWNYRPLAGYRNPTDEADLDWQNRRDYLRSPEYENQILDAASTITARRAAEKRNQAAKEKKMFGKSRNLTITMKDWILWVAFVIVVGGVLTLAVVYDVWAQSLGMAIAGWIVILIRYAVRSR